MKDPYLWELYCTRVKEEWERKWLALWTRVKPRADGCLEWTGDVSPSGYGQCSFAGKRWLVHRLVWTAEYGPIPEGREIHHQCELRLCVNVEHFELSWRGRHGRNAHREKRYCKYGHEFTPENTRFDGKARWCRTCTTRRTRKATGAQPLDDFLCAKGLTLVPYLSQTRQSLGLSRTALATVMGLSQSAIWRMETKPTRPKRATVERLANILGVDQTQILGPVLPAQPDHGGYRKGENHPAAKVTEEIVLVIRKEYAAGASCKELSIKYGLKYTTTHHIIRKTTWKSVS